MINLLVEPTPTGVKFGYSRKIGRVFILSGSDFFNGLDDPIMEFNPLTRNFSQSKPKRIQTRLSLLKGCPLRSQDESEITTPPL